jgi:quercetin dioxygenase-like cupin family protein
MAAAMEPDNPGMHQTATVDYGIVLDGEVVLELDDGAQTVLTAGDTIVQLGSRHAWRNKSDRPATVAFVLTGVTE